MQVKNPPKVQNFLGSAAGIRFTKLVGLLTSDGDGERANAAAMATKLLKAADLSWAEVVGVPTTNGTGGLDKLLVDDLRMKLRIAQELLAGERMAHNLTKTKLKTVSGELALAKNANIAGKIGEDLLLRQRITRLAAENAALKKAAANPNMYDRPKDKPEPAPKAEKRKYASDLQKIVNEAVDAIEAAIELNDWEQSFLTSIRDLRYRITQKQLDKLTALAKQAGVEFEIDVEDRPF